MPRAIILVLDSFGIGAACDAEQFGDSAANTYQHIQDYCLEKRGKALTIPNLIKLGLDEAARISCQHQRPKQIVQAAYGAADELSFGKDTPSGHWEMCGLPVEYDWGYFPTTQPCFPKELSDALIQQADLPGLLGNKHASGTEIIAELGAEHINTGKPIVYTSADSVLQIAAHEQHFGLQRLYDVCAVARKLVDKYNVGRVIARPFVGEVGSFKRTANRRDLATPPHGPTLLDHIVKAGHEVIAVGKIGDIFAHQGISKVIKGEDNHDLFMQTLTAIRDLKDNSLLFTNFVDFDSSFGHRRDVLGYAEALEAFDALLPQLLNKLQTGDLLILSADHGCDPTAPGSDHTRERIPLLFFTPGITDINLGLRSSFADIGQTVAEHLGCRALAHGESFYVDLGMHA